MVANPLPKGEGNKKCAFTLSEVLITLVVIGIVAAITVPAISRASEKYILKNQFKKTYSVLLNAINKANADLGGNVQCYYLSDGGSVTLTDCPAFFEQVFSNISVQKVCKGNAKASSCIPEPYMKNYINTQAQPGFHKAEIENTAHVYNLADGAIIIVYKSGPYLYPLLLVDINGAKGPNILGRDIAELVIDSDGQNGLKFRPKYTYYHFAEESEKAYFKRFEDYLKE